MKKFRFLLFTVLAFSLLSFNSCSDDDNDDGNNDVSSTFIAISYDEKGNKISEFKEPTLTRYEYYGSWGSDDKDADDGHSSFLLWNSNENSSFYMYFIVQSYKNRSLTFEYLTHPNTNNHVSGSFSIVDLTDKTITFEFKDFKVDNKGDKDFDYYSCIMNGKITLKLKKNYQIID